MTITTIGAEYGTSPIPGVKAAIDAFAAGKTGLEALTAGGAKALKQIVFSTNFAAADTITIGATTFTMLPNATPSSGLGIECKASLTLTLDEIVTVLNASAVGAIAAFTWSKVSTTTLLGTADAIGVNTTTVTAVKTSGGTNTPTTTVTGAATVAASLSYNVTSIALSQNGDQYFSLANGEEGQEKSFVLTAKSGTGSAVITAAGNFDSSTILTLDTVGEFATFKYLAAKWREIKKTGALA